MPLDRHLLELLRCPACRGGLAEGDHDLTCTACGLVYPVRDGVPVLLVDEATAPSTDHGKQD